MKRKKLFALGLVLLLTFTFVAPTFATTVWVSSIHETTVLSNQSVSHTGWYVSGTSITFSGMAEHVYYRAVAADGTNTPVSYFVDFYEGHVSGGASYFGILNANSIGKVNLTGKLDRSGTCSHKGTFTF